MLHFSKILQLKKVLLKIIRQVLVTTSLFVINTTSLFDLHLKHFLSTSLTPPIPSLLLRNTLQGPDTSLNNFILNLMSLATILSSLQPSGGPKKFVLIPSHANCLFDFLIFHCLFLIAQPLSRTMTSFSQP